MRHRSTLLYDDESVLYDIPPDFSTAPAHQIETACPLRQDAELQRTAASEIPVLLPPPAHFLGSRAGGVGRTTGRVADRRQLEIAVPRGPFLYPFLYGSPPRRQGR